MMAQGTPVVYAYPGRTREPLMPAAWEKMMLFRTTLVAGLLGLTATTMTAVGAANAPASFQITESSTISLALFVSGLATTGFLIWRAACWYTEVRMLRSDVNDLKQWRVYATEQLDILKSRQRRMENDRA